MVEPDEKRPDLRRAEGLVAAVLAGRGARIARRIVLTAVGAAVLVLGVALLALPGPGFLVVALGFFILSLEYPWARRRFELARRKAADLADQAAANRWSTGFSLLFGIGMAAAGIVWIVRSDLPGSSPWSGGSLIFSGLVVITTIVVSLAQARAARRAGEPTPAEKIEAARRDEPAR
jgi:uncharacterized protein (TIGR02611 family)